VSHRIEYMALGELVKRRATRNPKAHDVPGIDRSIERWGLVEVPTLNESTGNLVAGHGRLETLAERKTHGLEPPKGVRVNGKGQWLVPVLRGVAFDSDAEAEGYLLASNRLVESGGWRERELAELVDDLRRNDGDVIVGWDPDDLDDLLATLKDGQDGSTKQKRPPPPETREIRIVLDADVWAETERRLEAVMREAGVMTHGAALLELLGRWEATEASDG
jgi:hypothetical protein